MLILSIFGVYADAPYEDHSRSQKVIEYFDESFLNAVQTYSTVDADEYDIYAYVEFDYPDMDFTILDGMDVDERRETV